MHEKWVRRSGIAVLVFMGLLACRTTDLLVAQVVPTETPTRTPRPTLTPLIIPTDTPVPTLTFTPMPTATATRRPPTPRPPTPKPPPTLPPAPAQPTVSTMEFHVNPPSCVHAGLTFIKGTVYLNKNDSNSKYVGAIVALGPSDGSLVWTNVLTDIYGQYTFVLGGEGEGVKGNYWVWLVDPSMHRKSDIGGPINTNGLPDTDPSSCWAGTVDFWK